MTTYKTHEEYCDCDECSTVTVADMLYLDRLTRIPSPKNGARNTTEEE